MRGKGKPRVLGSLLPVLTPQLGGSPQPPHSLENRHSLCQELAVERKLDHLARTGRASTGEHFIVCKLFFGKQETQRNRSTLHQEKDEADTHHEQGRSSERQLHH